MDDQKEIKLDKGAVSRAIRKPLETYYQAVGPSGYDWLSERPGNWEGDQELFKSIFKSKYVSTHLEWLYVLELVYAVIDHNRPLKPDEFAEKLEELLVESAGRRDYLAIIPVAFKSTFRLPGMRGHHPLVRPVIIGEFTFFPAASSVKDINKIFSKHHFPLIDESDFVHATRTSRDALSREVLVTYRAHGSEDRLRFNVEIKFRTLSRLIEIFANLFVDTDSGFGQTRSVHHFFLLSKTTGELRRFSTVKPLSFDIELSAELLKVIKRPELNSFFADVSSSKESMYGRMRNAVKFFSMALSADDRVTSFLFFVISLESIFSRDKNAPIKATLADLASILCFPPEQRSSAHDMIRRAYDLRSSIVHSGASFVEIKDINAVKLIAARAIYCSLLLCKNLKGEGGKIEDKFFDHLRDIKLGVAKTIGLRAIWSLPEITVDED
ncbi:hypothetical protein GTH10_14955 [Burkholderia thailandensis]|uniref:HEPN domain-containing protein n=1 Tax=Burkholderia thailandensis TaxID=57975 RepID=UPI00148EBF44|nr:HEPN domain-containing protein [Burkholderia thailandensis]NOK48648.1 hypothetical protein [Burkholderia thailandensis]